VVPHRRELLVEGRAVKLGGRAFDILMALIESRGGVISKDALRRAFGRTGSSRSTFVATLLQVSQRHGVVS
jgi:DNA-binding response OmpR family regulator